VVGAHVLAAELAASRGDHAAGFLVPRTRAQVWAIPHVLRLLSWLPLPLRRALTSYGGGPAKMLDSVVLTDMPRIPSEP
jgi:hypothetical protein